MKKILITCLLMFLQQVAKAEKPNIIFFIADDMRPEMFNFLPDGKGKNLTPNIDRLVEEGTVMMGQHVASPVCTPSRYNCLTGRYASRAQNHYFKQCTEKEGGQTRVEFNAHIVKKDTTLPKLLKQGGYATGMVGKNHVIEAHGQKKFSDFNASAKDPKNISILKANSDLIKQNIREAGFDYVASVYHNNPDFLGLREVAVQNMDWITKGGLDFIDQYHNQPFFLYFATTIPHAPSEDNRSWNANPQITADGYLKEPLEVQPPRNTIPKRLKTAGISGHNKENLLWLDDALGALINKLEAYDILDNTIILFFNDHGQNAKGTLYQGGILNPSIIWKKEGFTCGSTNLTFVSNVDFAPTILEMAGIEYDKKVFDGESFLDSLSGKKQENRTLYFELGYARSIRKENWKYMAIRYPDAIENMSLEERKKELEKFNEDRLKRHLELVTTDPSKPFSHMTAVPGGGHAEVESTGAYPSYFDKEQLYDLSCDPGEQNNLANNPAYTDILKELKKELNEYIKDLPGTFGEFGKM